MKKLIANLIATVMVIGMIVFVIWAYVSTKDYVETTAKVTAVEFDPTVVPDDDGSAQDYKVTLAYTVDGKDYTAEIHAHQSDYSVDEAVKIKYDPEKPENTSVGNLSLPLVIGICVVTLVIAGISFVRGRRF